MSLKSNIFCLGLGSAGGKLYKKMLDFQYKGAAGNGSEQDLKALGDVPSKFRLQGFDGFGGHRDRAVDCLAENEEFLDFVADIKEEIVFVLFGGGGSTGSGCAAPVIETLLEERDENGYPKKIVCPVIALPSSNEAIIKHRNAYQAVLELQDLDGIGATFFIRNDVSEDYEYINATFTKMLDAFLSNESVGETNNFDTSEKKEMLRNSGAFVLSLFGSGKDPKLMLDKLTQDGIFAPIEEDKVCENIAIVHAGRDSRDITDSDVIAEVGKPGNVFEGFNGKQTVIAVSGLTYPVSYVSKLGELAQEAFKERQRNRKSSVKKLGALSFMETEPEKPDIQNTPKKVSKLDMIKKMQAMRENQ